MKKDNKNDNLNANNAERKKTKRKRNSRKKGDLERNRKAHQKAKNLAAIYSLQGDILLSKTGKRLYGEHDRKIIYTIDKEDNTLIFYALADWIESLSSVVRKAKEAFKEENTKQASEFRKIPLISEIIYFFRILIELGTEERNLLGLGDNEFQSLLNLVNFNLFNEKEPHLKLKKAEAIYEISINLDGSKDVIFPRTLKEANDIIIQGVEQLVKNSFLADLNSEELKYIKSDYINDTQQELNRFLLELGLLNHDLNEQNFRKFISSNILRKLPHVIDSNKRNTDYYPIYLEKYDIECLGPLPLRIGYISDEYHKPQICKFILDVGDSDLEQIINAGLHLQNSVEMRLDFRLRPKYNTKNKSILYNKLFSVRGKGVGDHLSLANHLINKALLNDISSLCEYFPIAKEKFVHHKRIANSTGSIVHAHSVVQLCKNKALAKSILSKELNYEYFSEFDPFGTADYIGINLPVTVMRARSFSILNVIRSILTNPNNYIEELESKIEYKRQIDYANSLINRYPFSLMSAASYMRYKGNLLDKYDSILSEYSSQIKIIRDQDQNYLESSKIISEVIKNIPITYFEGILLIVDGFLQAGLYRRAFQEIEKIEPFLGLLTREMEIVKISEPHDDDNHENNFNIFSGSILALYELAFAQYYLISDCEEEKKIENANERRVQEIVPLNRNQYVMRAWQLLNRADDHLNARQEKYKAIGESSQSCFLPYYEIRGKIYYNRALICFLFPKTINLENVDKSISDKLKQFKKITSKIKNDNEKNILNANFYTLHWFEKARLYSALNSSIELYIKATCFQCISYLMMSLNLKNFDQPRLQQIVKNENTFNIDSRWTLKWADFLRKEAIISYEKIGREIYLQLKEKSGISSVSSSYTKGVKVSFIPSIYEYRSCDNFHKSLEDQYVPKSCNLFEDNLSKPIAVDLSYSYVFKRDLDISDSEEGIYLFGPTSCYIYFARALFHLCSDKQFEFSSDAIKDTKTCINQWLDKLQWSYQLFNHAWCIADDLCTLESDQNDESSSSNYLIQRKPRFDVNSTYSNVGNSIGLLTPLRISEICILGKIFAAITLILNIPHLKDEKLERNNLDIDFLISDEQLYSKANLNCILNLENDSQTRYNGYLQNSVDAILEILTNERSSYSKSSFLLNKNISEIFNNRDNLLKKIFRSFH